MVLTWPPDAGCVLSQSDGNAWPRARSAPESCSPSFFWLPAADRATVGARRPQPRNRAKQSTSSGPSNHPATPSSVLAWEGLPVRSIAFEGVSADQLKPLAGHLPQAEGAPLTEDNLKRSLRQLYATGLYDTIEVHGTRQADGVALVFAGTPRTFIGSVGVDGAAGATMNMQLERASQLDAGTRLTQEKMARAARADALHARAERLFRSGHHTDHYRRVPGNSLPTLRFAWFRGRVRAWARSRSRAIPA